MNNMWMKTLNILIFLAFFHPVYSLIVVDGKIVAQWPDQKNSALEKSSINSSSSSTVTGFGFYSNPKNTIYGITMIVDFSDQPANFTLAQVSDWLNKPGFTSSTTRGSVRDYFYECSNGQLTLQNDVVGYYRAKNPKSYYEGLTGYSGSDVLVKELIAYFDPLVDFSKYDNDKNGTTESINFVYAGSGKTWGQGLWPHSGSLGQTKDGVKLDRYNMCDMGSNLTLYVFCHETGHMLFGWPDLYWFGDYCIMGNRMSDANPQAINDFYRADQGWIPTETIVSTTNANCKAWNNGTGYRYVNPTKPQEMFFWSVIKNTGRWSNVKGKGLLLYHFDASIGSNSSGTKRSLYVVEADGNNAMSNDQWPSPGSAATDFLYQGNKAEFSSTSNPASLWGLRIYNISGIADTMSFSVGLKAVATRDIQMHLVSQVPFTTANPLYNLRGVRISNINDGFEKNRNVNNKSLVAGTFLTIAQKKPFIIVPSK